MAQVEHPTSAGGHSTYGPPKCHTIHAYGGGGGGGSNSYNTSGGSGGGKNGNGGDGSAKL